MEIIVWANSLNKKTILTTNFGPYESVILHMVSKVNKKMDIVWIDSGYNTRSTYLFAEKVIKKFSLNIHIFNPLMSAKRRDSIMKGIPDVTSPLHRVFTEQVKLEPFERVLSSMHPEIWLTAIRKEQTAHRKEMGVVSKVNDNLIKVAPVFNYTESQMKEYISKNNLPDEHDYYDPTKVIKNRECGLHIENFKKK